MEAAKERARREGKTAGQMVSALLRLALTAPSAPRAVREPASVYGIRPFEPGKHIVTNALIDELRLDDSY